MLVFNESNDYIKKEGIKTSRQNSTFSAILLYMEEIGKNNKIDKLYKKAQAGVSSLGRRQKEIAISYLKKIDQKKISDARESLYKN